MKTFITGVCGGSASGKTTLANLLVVTLGRKNTQLISLDNYYHDFVKLGHNPATINYDHPDSMDINSFASDLRLLRSGNSVEIPVYNYSTHTRSVNRKTIHYKPYIIVEGMFLYNIPNLAPLFDLKIYIDTPEKVRLDRRIERDAKERNRTRQSVLDQFYRDVRPMHIKFVYPNLALSDRIVNGNQPFSGQVPGIVKQIYLQAKDQNAE